MTIEKTITFSKVEPVKMRLRDDNGRVISVDFAQMPADAIRLATIMGLQRVLYNHYNTACGKGTEAEAAASTEQMLINSIYSGLWTEPGVKSARSTTPKTYEEFCAQRNAARLADYLDINSKNKKTASEARAHRKALKDKGHDPDATSTHDRLLVLLGRQNADADTKAWDAFMARKEASRKAVDLLDGLDDLDMPGNA
jgi:hypothetical protein